jgi:hypothetical protein
LLPRTHVQSQHEEWLKNPEVSPGRATRLTTHPPGKAVLLNPGGMRHQRKARHGVAGAPIFNSEFAVSTVTPEITRNAPTIGQTSTLAVSFDSSERTASERFDFH